MTTCAAVTTWPEVPPHGVRLACCLPAGHDGEHACAEIEFHAQDVKAWEQVDAPVVDEPTSEVA